MRRNHPQPRRNPARKPVVVASAAIAAIQPAAMAVGIIALGVGVVENQLVKPWERTMTMYP